VRRIREAGQRIVALRQRGAVGGACAASARQPKCQCSGAGVSPAGGQDARPTLPLPSGAGVSPATPRSGVHGRSDEIHDPVIVSFEFYRHRLPHARVHGALYFVTWRLRAELGDLTDEERDLVAASLRHFDGRRYALHAYVVMNDHVHTIVEPHADFRLEDILHSWKSFTAKGIAQLRRRFGAVWQDEYFDRVLRDDAEYQQKNDYILHNPFRRWPGLETYRWCWAIGLERR
jgi:REP element-mobilizing transposase RayT